MEPMPELVETHVVLMPELLIVVLLIFLIASVAQMSVHPVQRTHLTLTSFPFNA
jgi:hypothetical protein